MIWQCLLSSGICALKNQTVKKQNSYLLSIMEGALKTSFVIPSIPGALSSFAAEIASQTSFSAMGQLYEILGFAWNARWSWLPCGSVIKMFSSPGLAWYKFLKWHSHASAVTFGGVSRPLLDLTNFHKKFRSLITLPRNTSWYFLCHRDKAAVQTCLYFRFKEPFFWVTRVFESVKSFFRCVTFSVEPWFGFPSRSCDWRATNSIF